MKPINNRPYSWLRKIESAIAELDNTPLLGTSFDWSHFASHLQQQLKTPHLQIHPKDRKWIKKEELPDGMGEAISIAFTASPIGGEGLWVMGKKDVLQLTTWLLTSEKKNGFSSEILLEGFYHFLVLQAMDALQNLPFYKDITLKLTTSDPIEASLLAQDIQISLPQGSVWGKLVLSSTFQRNWQEYVSKMPPSPAISELANNYELRLRVKVGSVTLSSKELLKVKGGDFILPDEISYNPHRQLGSGTLYLQGYPLFQTGIKNRQVEIGDFANEEEVMQEKPEEEFILEEENGSIEEKSPASLREIPLTLHIEIAKVPITLDKLLKLEKGNLLELPTHPGDAAILSINGKQVGKGELLFIGDTLGIRILEWG